mmetsp:Transcript_15158/g.35698  ORF Transcript_15158/g.35698 Transcript_15158/m.35698 type:complete len:235 (+) Transcript_15158:525-1229(+)
MAPGVALNAHRPHPLRLPRPSVAGGTGPTSRTLKWSFETSLDALRTRSSLAGCRPRKKCEKVVSAGLSRTQSVCTVAQPSSQSAWACDPLARSPRKASAVARADSGRTSPMLNGRHAKFLRTRVFPVGCPRSASSRKQDDWRWATPFMFMEGRRPWLSAWVLSVSRAPPRLTLLRCTPRSATSLPLLQKVLLLQTAAPPLPQAPRQQQPALRLVQQLGPTRANPRTFSQTLHLA